RPCGQRHAGIADCPNVGRSWHCVRHRRQRHCRCREHDRRGTSGGAAGEVSVDKLAAEHAETSLANKLVSAFSGGSAAAQPTTENPCPKKQNASSRKRASLKTGKRFTTITSSRPSRPAWRCSARR